MTFDSGVRYLESHEWARKEGDLVVIGISDYAQDSLGDVVFVEFPAVGKVLKKGEVFGVVESVKAASDLYLPMSGTVVETNKELAANPGLVNQDAFGKGWLIKLQPSSPEEYETLTDAPAYEKLVSTQG